MWLQYDRIVWFLKVGSYIIRNKSDVNLNLSGPFSNVCMDSFYKVILEAKSAVKLNLHGAPKAAVRKLLLYA